MKPIRLCLKGFSGILAGLGRNEFSIDLEQAAAGAELVAIAGPNGTGKTTILDNLHPYRVMPSRAGADSLGAFSFYEHLSLPEAEKALIWEHAGVRYRSQLLFRMNGRKKTDAYLHVWREGVWHPAVVSDGTLSDGKTDTYDRCIESILGSAETFFTSQFAAQGQRPLSAYRNGEIKNLLADLLGLESIQETGRQATEVAKLLRAGLVTARSELAGLEVELRALEEGQFRCDTLELAMQEGRNRKMQAGRALDEAQQTLANLNASAAVAAQHDALRARLQGEHVKAEADQRAKIVRFGAEERRALEKKAGIAQRQGARIRDRARRKDVLTAQQKQLGAVAGRRRQVALAQRQVGRVRDVVTARQARVVALQEQADALRGLRETFRRLTDQIQTIEQQAGRAELNAADLVRRLDLTSTVPCKGLDLQASCQLLHDAHEAKALIPSAGALIRRLQTERATAKAELTSVEAQGRRWVDVPTILNREHDKLIRTQERLRDAERRAAQAGEVARAVEALAHVEAEFVGLAATALAETDEERAESAEIESRLAEIGAERVVAAATSQSTLAAIDGELRKLPAPFDMGSIPLAEEMLAQCQVEVAAADDALLQLGREERVLAEASKRIEGLRANHQRQAARISAIDQQIVHWTLLAKALGNDGVIALTIDDAGPTLAGLACRVAH